MSEIFTYYPESNYDADVYLNGSNFYVGKIIQLGDSTEGTLTSVKFYLKKTGSPTGNITAELWSDLGPVVAASSDTVDVSTLTTSYGLIEFTFSGINQITLDGYTVYFLVIKYVNGDVSNYVHVGVDKSSSTYPYGYLFLSSDGSDFDPYNSDDLIFYLYVESGDVSVQGNFLLLF